MSLISEILVKLLMAGVAVMCGIGFLAFLDPSFRTDIRNYECPSDLKDLFYEEAKDE